MNVVRDQADAFEIEIIQRFRHEPHTQEITGYRSTLNGELFLHGAPHRRYRVKLSSNVMVKLSRLPEIC